MIMSFKLQKELLNVYIRNLNTIFMLFFMIDHLHF